MSKIRRRTRTAAVFAGLVWLAAACSISSLPETVIPSFPWPAPEPLDFANISDARFGAGGRPATLGDVARRLREALVEGADYRAPRFYAVRVEDTGEILGFAMVTALEQIRADGRPMPEPDRWSRDFPAPESFSLESFLRALFEAPRGDYRVIAFVVLREGLETSGEAATRDQAGDWLSGGKSSLPSEIAAMAYDGRYETLALVYQFRKIGHHSDPISNPDRAPTALQHLDRTEILDALRRR